MCRQPDVVVPIRYRRTAHHFPPRSRRCPPCPAWWSARRRPATARPRWRSGCSPRSPAAACSAVGFKVGPDHTDAAYLGAAAGAPGRNLDPRLVGAHRVAPLFAHGAEGHDIAVVEGTMGLFDSLAGRVETDSTAGVAAALRAPVVMVVDVGAMGQSVAALVHGFRAYDELTWLGGVILNRVASDRHEQLLREALDDIGVPVYGALRRRDLPSALPPPRSEGVVPVAAPRGRRAARHPPARRVDRRRGRPRRPARAGPLGAATAGDAVVARQRAGARAPTTRPPSWSAAAPIVALAGGPGAVVHVRGDARTARSRAAPTVVPVDPLRDELLPQGTDALVIGGALPEAYAEELSANRRLCADVADLARSGRPVIAEGAGLLWLAQAFDGRPMCGVLDANGTHRRPDGRRLPRRDRPGDHGGGRGRHPGGRLQAAPRRGQPAGRPDAGVDLERRHTRRDSSGGGSTRRS